MRQSSICCLLVVSVLLAQSAPSFAQPAPKPAPPADEQPPVKPGEKPKPAPDAPKPPADAESLPEAADEDEPVAPPPDEPAPPAAEPPDTDRDTDIGVTQKGPESIGAGVVPEPGSDVRALSEMDRERPGQPVGADGESVFAEDWWSKARPILELHGYFRVRAELFHNFSLGRIESPENALWPQPADNRYRRTDADIFGPEPLCTPDEADTGESDDPDRLVGCKNKTNAGANLRFRLNPELHISDNLRVLSQIDMLDNLVLGSTPEGYGVRPHTDGGYEVAPRSEYTARSFDDTSQEPPRAGINSFKDSIAVKRAWGEYATPIGELRFGRMPAHWGLGMLLNSGDGHDDDYQTTLDRILFITGVKPLDLFVMGAWDFANNGATSETLALPQGQPYDVAQLDDVDQYALAVFRRKSPELERLALAQGDLIFNGGVYVTYRKQLLANDVSGANSDCVAGGQSLGCQPGDVSNSYVRRAAEAWIPDIWLQLLYKKFRFELEAATVQGTIENVSTTTPTDAGRAFRIRQYGFAGQLEQRLVDDDKLKLGFDFGWASGDADVEGLTPGPPGSEAQLDDRTFSVFRFHPNYRFDLILHRNLLSRVQGTYFFRPSVEYDIKRDPDGQRFGGGFAAIWSRASEFMQTPGNRRDLGIELNGTLYYQAKDGALNDEPGQMGGFYTMLQYGVLFPLGGLKYLRNEDPQSDISTPQILRWYMGVLF